MIALTVDKADGFVAKLVRKGVKVKWDGWTMVFFKANPAARTTDVDSNNNRAVYSGGEWGFEERVSPDEATGKWLVNYRLAKGTNA